MALLQRKNQKSLQNRCEWRCFWTLVKMLLSDTMKLSFDTKANRKASLVRIVTILILFAGLTALGYLLYTLAILFGLFSLLSFVPETVPSIIASIILVFAFFNDVGGLVNILYFSEDNRLMITYPCRGSTVFSARLFVYFVKEYVRTVIVMVPVLLSYMLIHHFPWFMVPWLFLALALVTLALILVASLLSIPGYYVHRFLKQNSLLASGFYLAIFTAFIVLISWVIGLIPNKIDIFSNFGPYFNKIQAFLQGYRSIFDGTLYALTKFEIGTFDGFAYSPFTLTTLFVLLVIVGVIGLFTLFAFTLVSKLYLYIASRSFEYSSVGSLLGKKGKRTPFWASQLKKEIILIEKNPENLISIFGTFVFLPIAMTLINKIFGAMDTNSRGNMFISAVNFGLILLICLTVNETTAHLYSDEGKAFFLNRSYPKNALFIMTSKLLVPALIGIISICVTCHYYGEVNALKLDADGNPWISGNMIGYFSTGISCFYAGHLLFAAGLDFCNIKSTFTAQSGATTSQRDAVITAFLIAIFGAIVFYLYLGDGLESAYLKVMIAGFVFLALNIVLYVRKTKYLYEEGE